MGLQMSTSHNQVPAAVHDALRRGDSIGAIKLVREATGLGLKEAKDIVDEILRGNSVQVSAKAPSGPLPLDVVQALKAGHKIEAIKLLREQTGLGLKEAKDAVEAFEQDPFSKTGQRAPGTEVGSGGAFGWIVAAVAAALVVYFLSK